MNAAFAHALLDPRLPPPAGLRAWNGSDPARRFAVHRNNVLASLVDALAETFPVVQALVGVEFFRAMAAVFARLQPPASPLLHVYGDGFAGFIETFAPAHSLPYLADLARLEFARVASCHAADAAPLSAQAASEVLACGERVGALRLVVHPAARWLASRHPVVSLWAAHQGEGDLQHIDLTQAEAVLVVRPALDVLVLRCDAGTTSFLDAAAQRRGLADCAAAAMQAHAAFDLTATLSLLMAHGALSALTLPPESTP
jgi:hypothetical protein